MLEGKSQRDGDKVVVETDSGAIALPADMVKRIEPGTSDVQEFEARLAKLAPGDTRGLLALADYCRDHDMPAHEKEALQRILQVEPDHAQARARLGYVKTPSGWRTQDEQMEAQGFVKFEGRWVTRDELRNIERGLSEGQLAGAVRERDRARALQAEFDAEQAQRQASANMQEQWLYPTYGYEPFYDYGPRPLSSVRLFHWILSRARAGSASCIPRSASAAPRPRPRLRRA